MKTWRDCCIDGENAGGFKPPLRSLDVAQQSHAPQDPELWRKWSLQVHGSNVVDVGPHWFFVDGTGVEAGILHTCGTTKTRLFK